MILVLDLDFVECNLSSSLLETACHETVERSLQAPQKKKKLRSAPLHVKLWHGGIMSKVKKR